jgi:hypothetical protein
VLNKADLMGGVGALAPQGGDAVPDIPGAIASPL